MKSSNIGFVSSISEPESSRWMMSTSSMLSIRAASLWFRVLKVDNRAEVEEQSVSSIMNIEFKDDNGHNYNTTFLTEGTNGQLDGSVSS